ncbi:erythromycin esterase family protein [Haloplanus pelagicus]|jgi:erythromycin esterase|uniref:erythromycin esterase family protein n=1 Tax=Haloplanus pelagicus TaxID=2949995 RepID=UPI0020405097|nr:erythromycin esterase family protein [Haloplanus sp. HW8-1]
MGPRNSLSRRRVVALTGALATGSLAGCAGGETADPSSATPTDESRTTTAGTPARTATETAHGTGLVDAIEREAVSFDPAPASDGLDAVAARLSESPLVGIGENSHGVAEFKTLVEQIVRRLVADHGYRLVAIEGTLGDFAAVNDYITGGGVDLDSAMAGLDFYFWRTAAIRGLFEWLREFNAGRPPADRAVVRGYDAQFFDVNATAVRSYLDRVDPAYLAAIDDDLRPLTEPLYERHDVEFVTESRTSLFGALRDRLRERRDAYVAASSVSEWRLIRRHLWTLERGLRFQAHLSAEAYTRGKRIRDEAMAKNVAWLRDWTGAERAVVLGSSNHTMRNDGLGDDEAARMGHHLTRTFGDDYYSLGCLFGTGRFTAPTDSDRSAFATHDLDGPVPGTLAATLVDAARSPLFLDFESARDRPPVDALLDDTDRVQFSVPRAAKRGALPLSMAADAVYDGVVFVRTASPASFSAADGS